MTTRSNVIGWRVFSCMLTLSLLGPSIWAAQTLQQKLDSLFVIASSGEIKYQSLVGPAVDSIAAVGAEAVPFLVDKLTTKSARERVAITSILTKIGSPAVPYLVRSLSLDDDLIVQRVAGELGDIKDSSAAEPLMKVSDHKTWQVREQAVGSLGKIGAHAAGNVVAKALLDTIGQVRKSAAVAAGQLVLTDNIPQLVHMLGDDFYGARMCAFHSLSGMDTTRVLQTVIDSIDSPNHFVGDLGCQLLGGIGTEEALDALLTQINSRNPNRRAHAAMALVAADPQDTCAFRQHYLPNEADKLARLKVESAVTAAQNAR
jgi:HEAT repeat protein